ncbi:TPA: TetR/AcrR family transcriptional regulator, partial [Acinetobacter baumannii]|nr:TetR/AcrR family transcriptional regulator [Acinetobacter baumannii]
MIFMTNRHETDLVNEDTLKKKRGR